MKAIRYIVVLFALCITHLSCERVEGSVCSPQGTGKQIVFAAENSWPEITKAPISNVADMINQDFIAWGTWNQDSFDYSESASVFTNSGVLVKAKDNGDGIFKPAQDKNDKWEISDKKSWHLGYYNFAAVFPKQCADTHTSSFRKYMEDDEVCLEYINTLKIKYNIPLDEQNDCMYAFRNVDNSDGESTVVNFNFYHALSLLSINISASTPQTLPGIRKITLKGLHTDVTQFTVTHTERVIDGQSEVDVECDLKEVLKSSSVQESSTFKSWTYSSTSFDYGTTSTITPIQNILVFPETLSEEAPLIIEVEYVDDTESIDDTNVTSKTRIVRVTSGDWESGRSYAYTLELD